MNIRKKVNKFASTDKGKSLIASLLVIGLIYLFNPKSTLANVGTIVPGNPTCQDLGYTHSLKIDNINGKPITASSGLGDGVSVVNILSTDGVYLDWSSNFGIDAVIMKGGEEGARFYEYDPESYEDTGLYPPINPSGKPAGISHVTFCYDYELQISKTAETTYTRTYGWTIDKSVKPETWNMFKGDTGKSEYTIEVTKDEGIDRDWGVSGEIVVTNPAPYPATIERVEDQIIALSTLVVECDVEFPYELSSGETLTCTYEAPLSDGTFQVNSATVVTSGDINGNTTTADIVFGEPTTKVNDKINVSDSNSDGTWGFSDDGSVSYEETFTCNEDEGNHENTATIDETDQSDSASVDVKCNEIEVKKDAKTSYDRKWEWTIDKSADQTDLLLSDGQIFDVNYEVEVDAEKNDSNFEVKGTITVENPADIDAKILGVSDVISGFDGDVDVDCDEIKFPYTLTAGEKFECEYSADMDDKEDRTNTATAKIQNYVYDKDNNPTEDGTTKFEGKADVIFSKTPDNVTDNCIDVSDTNTGYLGKVCSDDILPKIYGYALSFGKHDDADVNLECGDNTHINIASFVTSDTETTGEDSWSVDANVECDIGCTLTQGYWKTHSSYGKAPYDDTWAIIGEDTEFFLSKQTYYEVLWTAPKGGNVYYQLAHQYIAALLNQHNGADTPNKVEDALIKATGFFTVTSPVKAGTLKGNARNEWTKLAELLASYNEGDIGPGHCSE